jgi:hypothetical protein
MRYSDVPPTTCVAGRGQFHSPCDFAKPSQKLMCDSRSSWLRLAALVAPQQGVNKGQKAMRLALLYPEPEKGGARKRGSVSETKTALDKGGISAARLSQARAVLAYSRELALPVRDGLKTLDDALVEVKQASSTHQTTNDIVGACPCSRP